MRPRGLAAALLVAVAASLAGCVAAVADHPDPVHAEKLSDLERRMDRVEQRLPK